MQDGSYLTWLERIGLVLLVIVCLAAMGALFAVCYSDNYVECHVSQAQGWTLPDGC